MKLNFLNVLNGKANHEEIAEQIVALEIKQKECEKERDISKILCKEVRGKNLCGERISPDVIRNADKGYEEAVLDLEIITDCIADLKKKLVDALWEHRQVEEDLLNERRRELEKEREKTMREFAKAKGRLAGFAFGICGHPASAVRNLESERSFTFTPVDAFYEEFNAEYKKTVSELKRPLFADLDQACSQKNMWLQRFNVDEEYEQILKKYREVHGAGVPEEEQEGA